MFTSSIVIWATISLFIGFGIAWFIQYLRAKAITVKWYEWAIGISGLLLILFSVQNILAGYAESEPKSALMFVLLIALPGLILMGIAGLRIATRQKRAI